MNIQNLREKYPELIRHMKEHGYNHYYVERLERQIKVILSNPEISSLDSYSDVYQYCTARTTSKDGLRCRLTFLGIIERFALRGEYPDDRTRQKIKTRGKYQFLSPEFHGVMDTYQAYEERRGVKKSSTIYGGFSSGASFLYELQCAGISVPEGITQKSIIPVFLNQDGTLRRSCSCKKTVAAVFRANIPANPELYNRLIAYLPELRETRKNIQYLTDEEVAKIKRVLAKSDSALSLRDKAAGILALVYGLRCCDIAKLKIDEVDLESEKLSICQQKAAVPLELPPAASVGNAIYDCAESERPKNGSEFVFLSENRPYGRLAESSAGNIAAKIMAAAGIRQNESERKGFHIFRRRLAAGLLGNGISQPIISKIAGHASPDSLETYLSADFVHLKEFALGIERFPLRMEVFANA
ncbi:MAG: tyrosine-type recombinase/integrase [Clostridiales bacterium]|jgi:integrase|nr:tyrosine-type recombinase/integrase [Clostridiales bacterium]